ncbi:MAG: hypothetical protein H0W39_01815 [Sphingomonas sp.]|nr:hypothetical protein [Sphingomonas sp.]
MSTSPTPSPAQIPVICDKCRASGMAGDHAFAAIPDILEFEPVPRRPHANGWSPEHQRAFIAALAITGSPRQAARHVGRAQFGADQLRTAKGGRSFAAAWDSALDLARDRELHRLHDNLGELSRKAEERDAKAAAQGRLVIAEPSPTRSGRGGNNYDEEDEDSLMREVEQARENIRRKLLGAKRLLLLEIHGEPHKRAAWEVLCGPVDWDAADTIGKQPDEDTNRANMRQPDMLVTAENGWLADLTGDGEDKKAELRRELTRYERENGLEVTFPGEEDPSMAAGA